MIKILYVHGYKETYDIPGGHHLSEAAAKKIMTEIAPMLIARFKSRRGLGHTQHRLPPCSKFFGS